MATPCNCDTFNSNLTVNGSVGVGTSAPRALLSFGTAVQTNIVYLYDAGGGAVYGFGIVPNTLQIYSSGAITTAIAFGTYDGATFAEGMRLQAGHLGIGTTTSGAQLEVVGTSGLRVVDAPALNTAAGSLIFGNYPDPKFLYAPVDGTLQWRNHSAASGHSFEIYDKASSTVKAHIDVAGASYFTGINVGIGTTSPQQALDVNGTVRTTGMLLGGDMLLSGGIKDSTGQFTRVDYQGCYYA